MHAPTHQHVTLHSNWCAAGVSTQMLDAFIDENMLIIIFEWAPAGDLKRLIKKTAEAGKTLDEPAIWTLFYQVWERCTCNVDYGAGGSCACCRGGGKRETDT